MGSRPFRARISFPRASDGSHGTGAAIQAYAGAGGYCLEGRPRSETGYRKGKAGRASGRSAEALRTTQDRRRSGTTQTVCRAEARQDAACREQQEQQQQEIRSPRESPSILAFDGDDEPPRQNAFFGD